MFTSLSEITNSEITNLEITNLEEIGEVLSKIIDDTTITEIMNETTIVTLPMIKLNVKKILEDNNNIGKKYRLLLQEQHRAYSPWMVGASSKNKTSTVKFINRVLRLYGKKHPECLM